MGWLYYLLESNLYLILFYGFYRLFLHRETFYGLNRYYLIFSPILAFILPFFQLGFLRKEMAVNYSGYIQIEEPVSTFNTANALLLVYITISIVLTLKILWGLRHIAKLMQSVNKNKENGITFIEIRDSKMAFSFFNLLFIDPEMDQKSTVLKHEMVHIKQKHSFDILLFELVQISSWFNPVIYFIKNDIRLVHEYLADEATTKKDIAKYDYALFLIQNSYGNQEVTLSNHFFNSSLLKNRISMLNQKKSAKWARLKLLLIIPLTGFMLCLSTTAFTKDYGTIELGQKRENLKIVLQDTTRKKSDKKKLAPPPPIEPNSAKTKKAPEIRIDNPHKTLSLKKGKKLPPPIVIRDKETLPAPPPPPIETKPVKKGNDNEPITIELVPSSEAKTIQRDHALASDQKDIKEVIVKGYPTSGAKKNDKTSTVQATPVKEVVVTGYPKKQ